MYTSDERASFEYDFQTKTYSQTPKVVIKKERLEDVNIKCGFSECPEQTFKCDIRISCNSEVPREFDPTKREKTTREKERTTFVLSDYLRLDFTVVKMHVEGKNPHTKFDYEVELELADLRYLVSNLQNYDLCKGFVRRFLQNTASLTNLMFIAAKDIDFAGDQQKQ